MLQLSGGSTPRTPRASRKLSGRFVRRTAAVLTVPLLITAAAACGGDGSSDDKAKAPGVSGPMGKKPKIEKGEGDPPGELDVKVLKEGKGEKVKKGDTVNAHYLGQLWDGKEFDSSWKRKQPADFMIGKGKVIPGWDKALVGKKLGSRVEIVAPPEMAYGEQGQPPTIPGNSTLVFVVDLNKIRPGQIDGKPTGAAQNPELPKVSDKVEKYKGPSFEMPKGKKAPDKVVSETLVKGDGKEVTEKSKVLAHFSGKTWDKGQALNDTWGQSGSPVEVPVSQLPGWAEALKGAKEGSRVVFSVPESAFPKQEQQKIKGGAAFVVDVLEVS